MYTHLTSSKSDQPLALSSASRRFLLKALASSGLLAAVERNVLWAQTAPDYKALVHIYQQGGNDGNNMLIRTDAAGYNDYATARPVSTNINIAQASLLPIQPSNYNTPFGLHPSLKYFQSSFANHKLAILANMGNLVKPGTRDQFKNGQVKRPANLFSHTDQELQIQSAEANGTLRTGWGGRTADKMEPLQANSSFPMLCSINGLKAYTSGNESIALALPSSVYFSLYYAGDYNLNTTRDAALNELLLTDPSTNAYDLAVKLLGEEGLAASAIVKPILQNTSSIIAPFFAPLSSGIANQLRNIAFMLEGRAQIKLSRQLFFANQGGYDTHGTQINDQKRLLDDLNAALEAFDKALTALGLHNNVTSFITTDFSRTLKANAAGGSEHAWGNFAYAWGGAVKGGQIYGKYPTIAINGPDDLDGQGRWVPTLAVEQFAAPLLRWFGLPEADMPYVLPNMAAFDTRALAFI